MEPEYLLEIKEEFNLNVNELDNVASPDLPPAKQQKIDLTNPCYLKPFEHGWRRELVYRSTLDKNMRKNSDVYYFTPSGKCLRSMKMVKQNLKTTGLTMDDFTFYKAPLGVNDPNKEVIRDAKKKGWSRKKGAKKKEQRPSPEISSPDWQSS